MGSKASKIDVRPVDTRLTLKGTTKRVILMGDEHCGHWAGLTHPDYWMRDRGAFGKWGRVQREAWNFYERGIKMFSPVDLVVNVGDSIDGKGPKSGACELITADRNTQCEMAAKAILAWKAPQLVMVHGTGYHVGSEDDWETMVSQLAQADEIGSHAHLNVNGLNLDVKHHLSGSSIPHGRFTALAREKIWNLLWSVRKKDGCPNADLIVRGHVHYHAFCGGLDWTALSIPALQGPGSIYGKRRCSGTIDFGFIVLDIDKEGDYKWQPYSTELTSEKPVEFVLR